MVVRQFINSIFNSNTYIIHKDNKAIIVDIGDYDLIKNYLDKNHISPVALLISHVHYDHIYGLLNFIKDFPEVPVYTSKEGVESFKNPKWNFSRYHDDPIVIDSPQIKSLSDGEVLFIDNKFYVKSIYTPGHDHSCLTYEIEDKLFTGDSYIPDVKVVATFPKSNKDHAKLWYDKLKNMGSNFIIYPGHGPVTFPKNYR